MNKTDAQKKAIDEKYDTGSINKKKESRYDTEGGKEHKEEKEEKRDEHKCSVCGKMH